MKKIINGMLATACIFTAALLAGCSEKEEIDWVMPSATTTAAATETDAGLTLEDAEAMLAQEFADTEITYVEDVTTADTECYRFLITAAEEEDTDAQDGEAEEDTDAQDAEKVGDADTEDASPYDMVSDYYDVAKDSGKIVGRQISEEKAQAMLEDAFGDSTLTFTCAGELVTIYELTYLVYQAEGIDDNIYITSTFGNEVFTGYYDEETEEWVLEIIATYGVNEEQ